MQEPDQACTNGIVCSGQQQKRCLVPCPRRNAPDAPVHYIHKRLSLPLYHRRRSVVHIRINGSDLAPECETVERLDSRPVRASPLRVGRDTPRGDATVSRKTIHAPSHMGMDIAWLELPVRRCIGVITPVLLP